MGELNQAIAAYQQKWDTLVSNSSQRDFLSGLVPTAVAWKTEDLAEFDTRFAAYRELSDQVHLGWINDRWLATFHLREGALAWNMQVIKLMQRRPGSTDAIGLDHLDFYAPNEAVTLKALKADESLHWTEEKNIHCQWLSIWFDNTEAKLRTDTVVSVAITELQEVNAEVTPAT